MKQMWPKVIASCADRGKACVEYVQLNTNKCLRTGLNVRIGYGCYRADLLCDSFVFVPAFLNDDHLILNEAITLIISYNTNMLEICTADLMITSFDVERCCSIESKGIIVAPSTMCTITADLLEYIQKHNPGITKQLFKGIL